MKKISVEFSEDELRQLAEMSAFCMTMMALAKTNMRRRDAKTWQRLCAHVFDTARQAPGIGGDMEYQPDLRQWVFRPKYMDKAFYTDLLDEARDSIFWSELVHRMADNTLENALPDEDLDELDDDERTARVASLEQAIWDEVSRHGLDRLVFMLAEEDS